MSSNACLDLSFADGGAAPDRGPHLVQVRSKHRHCSPFRPLFFSGCMNWANCPHGCRVPSGLVCFSSGCSSVAAIRRRTPFGRQFSCLYPLRERSVSGLNFLRFVPIRASAAPSARRLLVTCLAHIVLGFDATFATFSSVRFAARWIWSAPSRKSRARPT
jgi:hypothetical protein